MPQDPPKEGNPKNNSQDSPKIQENPTIAIDEGENQQSGVPVSPSIGAKSIGSSKEDTNLDTNTEAEIEEEEDTEASSPKGTPDQPRRGRKSEKKRREELSYKEVTLGTQHTIPAMINTRQGSKQGKTPKGAPLPQTSK